MEDRSDRYSDRGDRGGDRGDRGGDRGDKGGGGRRGGGRSKYRTEFSGDQVFEYKDPLGLWRFVSDGGKIMPARLAKLSIAQQKRVSSAVKKARNLALLPNGTDSYDYFGRAEAISPVPFEI